MEHAYKFPLPHWHLTNDCPWCNEKKIVNKLSKSEILLDTDLSARDAALSDKQSGMEGAAFWLTSSASTIPNLGANSNTLDSGAKPIQVLFACASAVQQLRHLENNPLCSSGFPIPSYLAERVFSQNFTEELIWISLLRSLKSCECEQALKDYLSKKILEYGSSNSYLYFYAELALAMLSGKFGSITDTPELKKFLNNSGLEWNSVYEAGYIG